MTAQILLIGLLIYIGLLYSISLLTSDTPNNLTFYTANKKAPWYIVAFGMVGATLSGLTFISVPGWVASSQLSYIQMVLGYGIGYFFIATILMPLYYKFNLITIYSYLENRFGKYSYKTATIFFLISRLTGTCLRLFLVLKVLHWVVLDKLGFPFGLSAAIALICIWIYTNKSGLKTIVYTDVLQTIFMLASLGISLFVLYYALEINSQTWSVWWNDQPTTKIFFWKDWNSPQHFLKQFFSGILIAFAMTGLDQEMMQKNLSCKSLKDAQKNMFWFTIILIIVTILFLVLGVLLSSYAEYQNINIIGDRLFPFIVTQSDLGGVISYVFIFGLIAAAFSSADLSLIHI